MLMPKRVKYRKVMRGRLKGKAWRGNSVTFGTYGLQAVESHYITSRQIEAARRAMVRYIRRGGKIWIRVFPDKPWTKRAAETRMGSGKGSVEHWVAPVRAGRVLFEMAGIREDQAREAMRLAAFKLPMRTQFVLRDDHVAGSGDEE